MQRLNVAVVVFAVESRYFFARSGIVGIETGIGLVAIDLDEIERRTIGRPSNISEIAVGYIAKVEVAGGTRSHVGNADGHLMRRHSSHRIFVGSVGSHALKGVDLRIVGHHRLVHAIERQLLAVGRKECAFVDSKLVAVYALPVYNLARAVGAKLMQLAVLCFNIQVVVLEQCPSLASLVPLKHTEPFGRLYRLVSRFVGSHLLACGEVISEIAIFFVENKVVAIPARIDALRRHLLIVFAAEVQIFERKQFLRLCAGTCNEQCSHRNKSFHYFQLILMVFFLVNIGHRQ